MDSKEESRRDEQLAELAEDFSRECRDGRSPDVEEYALRHPQFADEIRRIFPSLAVLEEAGKAADEDKPAFSFFGRPGQRDPRVEGLAGVRKGQILGDFEILEFLGAGGMGQVWMAEQRSLSRKVALKLILPERLSEHTLALFAREARAGGRLTHPGIVAVHDHGVTDGHAWIAMELVPGGWSLKNFIEERVGEEELPAGYYSRAAEFVADLADAVQSAHEEGVVHRDLKPANVLIGPDEKPKVTDFGLAKITDETALSRSGDLAGTYSYMSPEQVEAKRIGIDHRTDIFSLGVVLYELLTLRRPFVGDTSQQIAKQILLSDPPDPRTIRSQVPWDLAMIAAKCLEKDTDRRYPTMRELADDLRRHLASIPIKAKPPTTRQRLAKWAHRHPTAVAICAVSIAALAVISTLLVITKEAMARAVLARESAEQNVLRLAFTDELDELKRRASSLWPPSPEMIPELEAWLAIAEGAVARLDPNPEMRDIGHRAALAELRGRSRSASEAENTRNSWWIVRLENLVARLEGLSLEEGFSGAEISEAWGVRKRLRAARRLEQIVMSGEWHERWEQAIVSISDPVECPLYEGLVLPKQEGLIPIGRDPNSMLWEFSHILSGDTALRDRDGELSLTAGTGLVFVLIPPGSFPMGAQHDDHDRPNYDMSARPEETPVHEVSLLPFFLSKYEMTQGAWKRLGGRVSTSVRLPVKSGDLQPLHPVILVAWSECASTLNRFELNLPTEAQWEYAARAGAAMAYDVWGMNINLTDVYYEISGSVVLCMNRLDGYSRHAPVDSFEPNAFGLFNVCGNVWEWCRDTFDPTFYAVSPASNPIQIEQDVRIQVRRGGSFRSAPRDARLFARLPGSSNGAYSDCGVRPMRSVAGL